MAQRRLKVLVTHPEVPQKAIDILKEKCEVIVLQNIPPKQTEILEKSKGCDAIFWASHNPLNAEALDASGPQLKAISTMSAGIDYVDVPEVKRRKIPLGHTPRVLSAAVAEIAIGLMIAACRRFQDGRKKIETSTWETDHLQWMLGQDIRGATVGFFGFGNIAIEISRRLKNFEIGPILYTQRQKAASEIESEFSTSMVSFDDLLAKSDILFIAAPLTESTKGVFNSQAFEKMKPTSVLVNIARGPIVDQVALYNALKSNKIFAAGIDVMVPEPLPKDNPLLTLPNIVIVPHLGSATLRTRADMAVLAANNILCGLDDKPMLAPAY